MKIGIIGSAGIVGSAISYGFQLVGHTVIPYDIKLHNTFFSDVLNTPIVYICVPTPQMDDGSADIRIVESVIEELANKKYAGHVVIKSTVPPGTTHKFQHKYFESNIMSIMFVPEFLRERCANSDFTENHDLLIIGGEQYKHNDETRVSMTGVDVVKSCHAWLPKKTVVITATEAEFCKYYNNIYNATLVTLANAFYDICQKMDVNYDTIKSTITQRSHITKIYQTVNENLRGFGGACLPKDTAAIAALCKQLNVSSEFFDMLLSENNKHKKTIIGDMRLE